MGTKTGLNSFGKYVLLLYCLHNIFKGMWKRVIEYMEYRRDEKSNRK